MNIEILMKQFNNMSSDSRMKFAERLTKEYPSVADDLSFKLDAAYQDAVVESGLHPRYLHSPRFRQYRPGEH